MSERINVWGYSFEPATGRMFDEQNREMPFTFQSVSIVDGHSGQIYGTNPLQFATKSTAEKVLTHLRALAPGYELKLTQMVWAGGPYVRPAIEYGIETPSGTVMNAGLVANTLMRSGPWADAMLRAELATYSQPPSN